MSYVSLLKNIPEFLSQPTGIAAIASLGIHGVIAFVMPLMPMESSSKQSASKQKTVGLVELNQAEMNRLPQTGMPQIALPTQQAAILPQVPPPNLLPQSTPALPPLPPPTETTSNLTIPPLPSATNVSIASFPKSQSLKLASSRDLQISPSYSQQVKPFPRYQQPSVSLGEAKPLTTSPIPYTVPPVQAANWRQQQEMMNNNTDAVTPDGMPMPADGNMASQTAQPGTEVPSASPYKPLIPLGETPKAGDNVALGPQIEQLPQESGVKVPGLPSVASQEMLSSTTNSTDRFLEIKGQYPNIETRLPISATVNSKVAQEGNVEGDLVINSQGQVESIKFNNNSVSSELKTAAREYFREYFQNNPTSANGKPKFYPFNIAFKSSSDVSKPETIQEIVAPSQITPAQASSNSQKKLIQRLRSPKLNPQLSQERKEDNVSQSQTANSRASSQEPPTNQASRLRPQGNEAVSVTSNNREVVIKQTQSLLPANREQASQRQVGIKQPVTIPQSDREQSSQQQQVVIKQPAPTPQASEEQASQQQEAESDKPSASNEPNKLIRQLRQIRERRQLENR
ncbi:hypothetical protein WA1_39050 [Scytonema hofmannii PCC 7110]|uniref:TonB C-terminal domain-containing protein n=1 Tax=Scytonema hofmannii PCC 7110 TaxID=128403 RepID=A0A139X0V0_9CYAN|nr:hypothetical protein [Scytonema hofmannii]KYC38331.1 hypothetical protein WA1_39050 [Scytonema hofmannii PCC 7110]